MGGWDGGEEGEVADGYAPELVMGSTAVRHNLHAVESEGNVGCVRCEQLFASFGRKAGIRKGQSSVSCTPTNRSVAADTQHMVVNTISRPNLTR